MRRPIKPFAVETRRTGRKPLTSRLALPLEEEKVASSPDVRWPLLRDEDDNSYDAAMRAADALFSRPEPRARAGQPDVPEAEPPGPQRRILPSLDEQDHISQLLAEEEAQRPRRARRTREVVRGEARSESPSAEATAPEEPAANPVDIVPHPGFIPGYVRGQIYSRYARHDSLRPGENRRKRSIKPLW